MFKISNQLTKIFKFSFDNMSITFSSNVSGVLLYLIQNWEPIERTDTPCLNLEKRSIIDHF